MDPIIPFDLKRMFLGDAPPLFLLEIAVRVILIWLWTIVLLRWVGGRSISQMSVVEFLLVIALGSAVGDPMFQPDVPLLHAMLVILLVVLADKAVDIALWRWRHAKRVVDGIPAEVMREGRILVSGAASRKLASSELLELLRLNGVRNLGEVERAFIEPSGELSIFHFDKPRPGLSIVPPLELQDPVRPAPGESACCRSCGATSDAAAGNCPECGEDDWTRPEPRPTLAG
jgi:uncharacterized membrane protein YcaP (DUF421 family)